MSRRFRSGTGGTYSGSTWEDWDGVSPNGRQYRNVITQETRNLSGAEYWSARKSDYPSQYPETWKDGKANIEAFKEEPVKKGRQKKEEPLEYKLYPQQKAFDKLEALVQDIEKKYLNLEISDEEYTEAMDVLEPKMAKAWTSLCKAKGWTEEPEEEEARKGGKVQHMTSHVKAGGLWAAVAIVAFIVFF